MIVQIIGFQIYINVSHISVENLTTLHTILVNNVMMDTMQQMILILKLEFSIELNITNIVVFYTKYNLI
jgi:hypothetical protein